MFCAEVFMRKHLRERMHPNQLPDINQQASMLFAAGNGNFENEALLILIKHLNVRPQISVRFVPDMHNQEKKRITLSECG